MQLNVALIRMVFPDCDAVGGLRDALKQAHSQGAQLAVLPEIPLNAWSPASKVRQDDEVEPPAGPRHRAMSDAAREVGIGLIGGAIIRDPKTGRCHNTALAFDTSGELIGSYRKLHLPEEEGFWETSHYDPGDKPPSVIHGFPMQLGIQVCSDVNRPEGSLLLGALGAEVIVCPHVPALEDRPDRQRINELHLRDLGPTAATGIRRTTRWPVVCCSPYRRGSGRGHRSDDPGDS